MEKFTDYPGLEQADIERFIDDIALEHQQAFISQSDKQQNLLDCLQDLLNQASILRQESLFS